MKNKKHTKYAEDDFPKPNDEIIFHIIRSKESEARMRFDDFFHEFYPSYQDCPPGFILTRQTMSAIFKQERPGE